MSSISNSSFIFILTGPFPPQQARAPDPNLKGWIDFDDQEGIGYNHSQRLIRLGALPRRYGMELRHLRYFTTAVLEGSVTKAAKRLNIAQPPLSRQLKQAPRRKSASHCGARKPSVEDN